MKKGREDVIHRKQNLTLQKDSGFYLLTFVMLGIYIF